ncbi:hypothetical protein [Sandaracinobacteroides saxicola]|uniref:AbrB/MazE/SpoVT family DNA-binding domain-containing protein n=1 Tax=Sandaracinobacteroides saxicola TaxID=2759707 RepID=A0A7G5IHD4_9SPHN|nr:hypothetical protein [Sandaracinobacteroides saxicola]QMW22776.1 hypothetical protein H3309_15985 [Sandaracinobacteroides saxicola]
MNDTYLATTSADGDDMAICIPDAFAFGIGVKVMIEKIGDRVYLSRAAEQDEPEIAPQSSAS